MPAPLARSSTEISLSGRSSSSRSAVSRIARSRSSPLARAARRPRPLGPPAASPAAARVGSAAVAMPPTIHCVEGIDKRLIFSTWC
jgi:hypothetical protein